MPYLGIIGHLVETCRIGDEQLSVEWQIPNFPSLPDGKEDFYFSPDFRFGEERWRLGLWIYREAETPNPASGWVKVALFRLDEGRLPKTFRFSLGIRGPGGGLEESREGEKEFSDLHASYVLSDSCSRSYLEEHRARLMPDDTLTFSCALKRPGADGGWNVTYCTTILNFLRWILGFNFLLKGVSSQRDASVQTNLEIGELVARDNGSQSLDKQGCEKAMEDFGKLLASGDRSDVTVQVGDVEFKVHSAILSVRSPALSVSLQHESKEKASSRIVVEDSEPDVFRDFLQYLYTGSVRSLTEHNVFGLYRIADKYLADDLKLLCLRHVQETLCVQTFCDTVKLALTHGESGLLQKAVDFAIENIQLIICTVEWQNFIRDYPTEANEILIKCICRQN